MEVTGIRGGRLISTVGVVRTAKGVVDICRDEHGMVHLRVMRRDGDEREEVVIVLSKAHAITAADFLSEASQG